MDRRTVVVAWLALAALPPATALANLPDPTNCTFDARVGRSPKNVEVGNAVFQYVLRGVLRNPAGQPIFGYPAQNDIAFEVLAPCQNPFLVMFDGLSDANGNVQCGVPKLDQQGGACTGAAVARIRSFTLGILKNYSDVMSPNEDGDAFIALNDLVTFQIAFVNGGPAFQGDLDLSGGPPALQDLVFFQRHFTAP